ncbi:MAG: magnesium transporter [Rhodothermales bacterium]|nr:magnesium transporter [Rhodothermales bacterium]
MATNKEIATETSRATQRFEVGAELVDNIIALVDANQRLMVLNLLTDLHPADCAALIEHLPIDRAQSVFRWLPAEHAAEVLSELEDEFRLEVLEDVAVDDIATFIEEMDSDDAVDLLSELPEEISEEVITSLDEPREIQELLTYDEESAGGIMGTEYISVPISWTVDQATEEVRRQSELVEPIFSVFVVDENEKLVGGFSLKQLLLSRAHIPVSDIVDVEPYSVSTDVDQEEVARMMQRYDLVTLPVVNSEGQIVGRITIDDVVDVMREEAEEDIQRMSGVSGGEEHTDSVMRVTRGRFPWLLAGLGGASLAAMVIAYFHDEVQRAAVLASFIPIVMATAGNAGIQSSAIAVQGLAAGSIWATDLRRRFAKELVVSVINGFALAFILGAGVVLMVGSPGALQLAFTAALTLIIVIVLATTIGAMVPLILHRFGIDPAMATGPFITTLNDIIGIIVFFVLSTLLYNP